MDAGKKAGAFSGRRETITLSRMSASRFLCAWRLEMRDIVYVRIRPHWMSVKNVCRTGSFEDVPQVAVDLTRKRNKVLGFGARANLVASTLSDKLILSVFVHPRSSIGDFVAAEVPMRFCIQRVNAP